MKSLLALSLVLGFASTALAGTYSYNAAKGKCLDANGQPGLNRVEDTNIGLPADIEQKDSYGNYTQIVFKNRSAECADLTNVDIDAMIRKTEYGYNYLTLDNWNFNGAVMNAAHIAWSSGTFSAKGANLTGLRGGYVTGPVTYDRFTVGLDRCLKTKTPHVCEWRL